TVIVAAPPQAAPAAPAPGQIFPAPRPHVYAPAQPPAVVVVQAPPVAAAPAQPTAPPVVHGAVTPAPPVAAAPVVVAPPAATPPQVATPRVVAAPAPPPAVVVPAPPQTERAPAPPAPRPAWSCQAGALLASDRQRPFGCVGNNDSSPSNQRSSLVQVHEGIREFLLEYPLLFPLGKKQTAGEEGEWQMRRPSISSNPARHHLKYIASGVASRKLSLPTLACGAEVPLPALERRCRGLAV